MLFLFNQNAMAKHQKLKVPLGSFALFLIIFFFFFTGYTGHWGHQFGDSSSKCLFCPGTDQHTITKQALLKAVILQTCSSD